MRRTRNAKIVATLGPASSSPPTVRRLFEAGQLGCSLVASGAAYGSSSLRNQYRAGFRIAYIESGWSRRRA